MAEIKVGQTWQWFSDSPTTFEVLSIENGEAKIRYDYGLESSWALKEFDEEAVLVEDVKVFKVGDYLTEEAGDIVWKVIEVGEDGRLLTEALLIQDADDGADVIRLAPEETSVRTMKKATPEQIEAFENHPYWGKQEPVADAISPSVYQFPNGVEVRDISAHLTSFGGQAVQYVCRSTRLDGVVKGKPVEDLKKAIQLLEWEVERLES